MMTRREHEIAERRAKLERALEAALAADKPALVRYIRCQLGWLPVLASCS